MATDSMTTITSLVRSDRSSEVTTGRYVVQTEVRRQEAAEARQENSAPAEYDPEAIEEAVSELREFVQNVQRNLDFHVDDVTGRVIVKVIDANSEEVIRQIPSEEMLALAQKLAMLAEANARKVSDDSRKGILIEITA